MDQIQQVLIINIKTIALSKLSYTENISIKLQLQIHKANSDVRGYRSPSHVHLLLPQQNDY